MNTLYKLANLLSGDYDYKRELIYFNPTRHYYNIFMESITVSLFFSHLIVFVIDDEKTKHEMVYYKLHEGIGERQTNFLTGLTALSFALIITIHRKYSKNIGDFKLLGFSFCYDENEMQTRFRLNQQRAKNQIRSQILFERWAWVWYIYHLFLILAFILNFASDNPSNQLSFYLVFKSFLYFLLYLLELSALLRVFLMLSQFNVSCLYLYNCLGTLIDEIERITTIRHKSKKIDEFAIKLFTEYNIILKNQRKLNHHCERNFYAYFTFTSFTIAFPIVILFEDPNEKQVLKLLNSSSN